ncbi:hypothetical protein [Sorangium sp. So ce131]|uniref:hypothetical protein n=1 Tax=Sorangium sp. So ce131 TaxID=3133282 RepID=UPI003F60EBB7
MASTFIVEKPTTAALRALNYTPEVEALRRRKRRTAKLGDFLSEMGSAYGAVFVRIDCDRDHGVELITQGDMFAAEPSGRIIRLDSMARPERHRVKRWQVLVSGAGTLGESELYGRSIIADDRLVDRYVGPHAMVLTFADPGSDDSLYTYAFLCSKPGIRAVRSTSFGTKILGLRKDLLRELPVPIVDNEVKHRTANLIRRCVEQRETYVRELQAARRVLEDLPEMREAHAMCAKRQARHVLWSGPLFTMNAWNYASTGGALNLLMQRWPGRLRDVVPAKKVFRGGRFQRISCDPPNGIDFLNQRDVFSIRPVPRRILHPNIDKSLFCVPPLSLLVGGQGTLGEGELFGQVALATPDLAKSGITEHLLRIQPVERAQAAICYAFLSTLVGRRLLRSTGVGTKLLSLREDLVLSLPYPSVDDQKSRKVQRHLDAASNARVDAANAESEAIRIIEEEVLPTWLA